jgi:exopolysaccharide biosynthesis polyprenyl glycosylphosphotransferase
MIAVAERDHQRAMFAGDAIAAVVFAAAIGSTSSSWRWGLEGIPAASESWAWAAFVAAVAAIWLICLKAVNAYAFPITPASELLHFVKASAIATAILVVLSGSPVRAALVLLPAIAITGYAFRSVTSRALMSFAGHRQRTRVLVIGKPEAVSLVQKAFVNRNGYEVLGARHVGTPLVAGTSALAANPVEQMIAQFKLERPDELVVALNSDSGREWQPIASACKRLGIPCQFVAPLHSEIAASGIATHLVGDIAVVSPKACAIDGLNLRLKQAVDLVLGLVCLILALPFMALIALAIRLDSEGPAIIKQTRVGYKGQPFTFYKFRTMYTNSDDTVHRTYIREWIKNNPAEDSGAKVFKLVRDKRVTRIGAVLRRYSIDELPQIFNVIKLDMSLVGPRPALPYEVDSYYEWHKERFDAPPGITGLWQVGGRNRLSFDEMAKLDIEYLRGWSLPLDFKVLARTIPTVLRGTGH